MQTTAPEFFGFSLLVLVLYHFLPRRGQNILLLAASYAFYITWEWRFAALLGLVTLVNYAIGQKLVPATKSAPANRALFWIGLIFNLLPLFALKYSPYLWARLSGLLAALGLNPVPELGVLLPIGLSFYTLQSISYLVDVYQRQMPPATSLVDFGLYLAYFPKLLAGPIERARNFLPKLAAPRQVDHAAIHENVTRIMIGLVRKLVIADLALSVIPARVFEKPANFPAPDLLFWWLVFAFVIYNDFAGYTGIVRGISGLFGIPLTQNFEQPMFSTSFIEFWNRWHISLSQWLRDYIYLPLSRALLRRNPSGRYPPNLVIPPLVTMLVSGLWHGINPHFLLWGALNGLLQGGERLLTSLRPVTKRKITPLPQKIVSWALFFVAGLVLAVPFKLEIPETLQFWGQMIVWDAPRTLTAISLSRPLFVMALSLLMDAVQFRAQSETPTTRWHPMAQSLLWALALLLIFLATHSQVASPFIYQEF